MGKVISYSYLTELIGDEVHNYIGEEPSGVAFNAPVFDSKGRPHNPMINAGAIMVCALLVHQNKNIEDVMNFYKIATSSIEVKYDHKLFLEEKQTGYANHALASLMLANSAFPKYSTNEQIKQKADEALDMYFQLCSILVNVDSLARFGSMLANNGVNPSSGERILKAETV